MARGLASYGLGIPYPLEGVVCRNDLVAAPFRDGTRFISNPNPNPKRSPNSKRSPIPNPSPNPNPNPNPKPDPHPEPEA